MCDGVCDEVEVDRSDAWIRSFATAATRPAMSAADEPQPPQPAVSVLMCAYNAAAFIREAVESILQQSMKVSECEGNEAADADAAPFPESLLS